MTRKILMTYGTLQGTITQTWQRQQHWIFYHRIHRNSPMRFTASRLKKKRNFPLFLNTSLNWTEKGLQHALKYQRARWITTAIWIHQKSRNNKKVASLIQMQWDEAVDFALRCAPAGYSTLATFEVHDEVFASCLQGESVGKAFFLWAQQLQWPTKYIWRPWSLSSDWGMSWLELVFTFYITTGYNIPIRSQGSGAKSVYIPYNGEEAVLLPKSKRASSLQILSFRNVLQNLLTITGVRFFQISRNRNVDRCKGWVTSVQLQAKTTTNNTGCSTIHSCVEGISCSAWSYWYQGSTTDTDIFNSTGDNTTGTVQLLFTLHEGEEEELLRRCIGIRELVVSQF